MVKQNTLQFKIDNDILLGLIKEVILKYSDITDNEVYPETVAIDLVDNLKRRYSDV